MAQIQKERARLDGELVTIVERKHRPKKNPAVTVRNGFGRLVECRAKDLELLDDSDPLKHFTIGDE